MYTAKQVAADVYNNWLWNQDRQLLMCTTKNASVCRAFGCIQQKMFYRIVISSFYFAGRKNNKLLYDKLEK